MQYYFDSSVIIITDFDFSNPSGAGFNRMENYSKALSSEGRRVIWISSRYNYKEAIKVLRKEHYVAFISECKISYQSTFSSLHFRRIKQFLKHSILALKQEGEDINNVPFLIYSSNLSMVWYALFYLKIKLGHKVYIEKNELQTAIANNKSTKSTSPIKSALLILYKPISVIIGFIADALAIWFNGIIVISTKFETTYIRFNKNVIRIPILADSKNYKTKTDNAQEFNFKIGYFGWVGESKDGLFSLIKAVESINCNISPKITLNIFGPGTKVNIIKLLELCKQSKEIVYGGNLVTEEVALRLTEYSLLAFPRPLNLQTKFGFSTKLAEFMASGVPVLTTDVSDNSIFVKDGENGFLMQGRKKIELKYLAQKIEEIVSMDANELNRIGSKGRETALKHFSPLSYSVKLSNFLA